MNEVFYVKPNNYDFPEAIKDGFIRALTICVEEEIYNISLVVSNFDMLDGDQIRNAFVKLFPQGGNEMAENLKRNRRLSLPGIPKDQTTGISVFSSNSNYNFIDRSTTVLLIYADENSLKKTISKINGTTIKLVAVVYNETDDLNDMLSALKAIKHPKEHVDTNVVSYVNTFSPQTVEILNKLKSINTGAPASHLPTKERMTNVIGELTTARIAVSYRDFLGFMVNDVNYEIFESIELLNWKHAYFNR